MRVLAFVGTRADLFPLAPVLLRLTANVEVSLHVATAVGFPGETAVERLAEAGLTPESFVHHPLGLYLDDASFTGQSRVGASLAASMSQLLADIDPQVMVILGDRWELLYVAPPAVLKGVRLVHLHGGEITEGAMDERVRHAMTKLSDQHCVATAGAARRVAQLAESNERIHLTGAPGLDRLLGPIPLSKSEFAEIFGHELVRPLLLVTYHPPTTEAPAPPGELARQVYSEAILAGGTVILTHPGFDAGREEILAVLSDIAKRNEPGIIVLESLGALYPRIMATVDALVGNSSSGILEAATFSVPAVNVGNRQGGREHGANVIHCADESLLIRESITKALTPSFKAMCRRVDNPYGDSHSAERIERVITASESTSLTKSFIEIVPGE